MTVKQPQAITSYIHRTEAVQEAADPQPGYYYVFAVDGSKNAVLLGPFPQHQQALGWVVACRDHANALEPWSHFYRFGTVRLAVETETAKLPTGGFNSVFPDAPGLITNHKEALL